MNDIDKKYWMVLRNVALCTLVSLILALIPRWGWPAWYFCDAVQYLPDGAELSDCTSYKRRYEFNADMSEDEFWEFFDRHNSTESDLEIKFNRRGGWIIGSEKYDHSKDTVWFQWLKGSLNYRRSERREIGANEGRKATSSGRRLSRDRPAADMEQF